AFAAVATAAVFTRVIAIALLVAPLITTLSGAVALFRSEGPRSARVRAIARYAIPGIFSVLIVGGSMLLWCRRNQQTHQYFGFAAMASLANLQSEVHAGMFD